MKFELEFWMYESIFDGMEDYTEIINADSEEKAIIILKALYPRARKIKCL